MNFDFDFNRIDVTNAGDSSALQILEVVGTGAIKLPAGTTGQQPTGVAGMFRYNSSLTAVEYFTSTWNRLQVNSAGLDALSALGTTGHIVRTGTDTFATRTLTGPAAGITVTNGNGVAGNPTLSLADDLAGLEGLATTGFSIRTGDGTWVTGAVVGTAGNISVTNGDGVAGNPTLNLIDAGTPVSNFFGRITTDTKGRTTATSAATQGDITTALGFTPLNRGGDTMTGTLTLNGDPTNPLHAATKQYVDNMSAGLDPKGSVRALATGNITRSGTQTIDGVALIAGNRVLLTGQTNGEENGIWVVAAGAWSRATDADTDAEVTSGMYVFVEEGTYVGTGWVLITPNPITLNTTPLSFTQFNGGSSLTGANGIEVSGNTVQTINTSLLRGLHGLATSGLIVRTGSGTVAARSIVVPTGMSIADADGISGNPTISLANDLAALEALSSTGFAVRTGADAWAQRTITGTANQITVTNGDGASANPTLAIASNAVLPGSINIVVPVGNNAAETGTTDGGFRYNSETNRFRMRQNGTWANVGTGDGTVTSVAVTGSTGLTVGGSPITSSGTITLTLGTELQGLAGLSATGLVVRTGAGSYAPRTLVAGTGISISNAAGQGGDITINNLGVTSVALALPAIFTVSGSPVTTTGTLTGALATQTANTVFAGPSAAGPTAPTFRSLVYADLPIALFRDSSSTPTTPSVTGTNSVAIGNASVAAGDTALALGAGSSARINNSTAIANGSFSVAGDAQEGVYVLRNSTTNATSTSLFLNGTNQKLAMPNNSTFTFDILIVGRRTDTTGGHAAYRFVGLMKRDGSAATTAIIGATSKTVIAESSTPLDATVLADSSAGGIDVQVNGLAGQTFRWVATVRTAEVVG